MSNSEWKLNTDYALASYANGVEAGEEVRLRKDLIICDHRGKPTGKIRPAGEVWTVLAGTLDEPEVVWLRDGSGDRHTWDLSSFFEWFERAGV
jgi:hypothetical protein